MITVALWVGWGDAAVRQLCSEIQAAEAAPIWKTAGCLGKAKENSMGLCSSKLHFLAWICDMSLLLKLIG